MYQGDSTSGACINNALLKRYLAFVDDLKVDDWNYHGICTGNAPYESHKHINPVICIASHFLPGEKKKKLTHWGCVIKNVSADRGVQ